MHKRLSTLLTILISSTLTYYLFYRFQTGVCRIICGKSSMFPSAHVALADQEQPADHRPMRLNVTE